MYVSDHQALIAEKDAEIARLQASAVDREMILADVRVALENAAARIGRG
jgi:hypothetical protein